MNKVFALTCILCLIVLAACESTTGGNKTNSGGGGCSPKGPSDDKVAAVKEEYLSGKRNAASNVPVPGVFQVGAMWEVTHTVGDKTMKHTFQVVERNKRNFIVEHKTPEGVVIGYEIDRSRSADQGNVARAWVGKPGWDPYPVKTASGWALPDQNQFMTGKGEPFADVEMGGKKWSGTVYTDGSVKTWIADGGYFNQIIKQTGGEGEWVLTKVGFSDKPKAWLSEWGSALKAK